MSERHCAVPGCPKPYYAKGLCMKHRERQRNGTPLEAMVPVRPKIDNMERDDQGRKQCSGCRSWFSLDLFSTSRSARDGFNQRCRACCALQKLLTRYNLTFAAYTKLLAAQGGACAICCGNNDGRAFNVDHDHSCCPGDVSCGKCVRGLLCGLCNRGIGMLGDDATRLRAAADYLERNRGA